MSPPGSDARRDGDDEADDPQRHDDGDQDGWLPPVLAFHQELQTLDVPHEFQVLPGIHEDEYWTAHLDRYLQFYSRALAPEPVR